MRSTHLESIPRWCSATDWHTWTATKRRICMHFVRTAAFPDASVRSSAGEPVRHFRHKSNFETKYISIKLG